MMKAVGGYRRLQGERLAWAILSLFVLALVLRAGFLLLVWGVDAPMDGDEPAYHGYAESFVEGNGWQNGDAKSGRPPLLPLQLAAIYSVTGPDTGVARWYMVVVSALGSPLVYLLARQIYPKLPLVAILAGMGWAVYPPAIWYGSNILTETMGAVLVAASVASYFWSARTGNPWAAGLTGALWGLAALNRSSFVLLPFFMLGVQLLLRRAGAEMRLDRRRWLLAFVAVALVLSPWVVRNYLVHGVFMPGESRMGYGLYITNGTLSDPNIQAGNYFKNPDAAWAGSQGAAEAQRDATLRGLAIDEIKKNWRLLPRPLLNRAKNFWTTRPDPYDPTWTRNDWIMLFVWAPVLVFFLASSFVHSWKENWPALAVVLYVFLGTLPFWGTPRFRFPVDPILITGAAAGFVETLRWATSALQRRERDLVPGN